MIRWLDKNVNLVSKYLEREIGEKKFYSQKYLKLHKIQFQLFKKKI